MQTEILNEKKTQRVRLTKRIQLKSRADGGSEREKNDKSSKIGISTFFLLENFLKIIFFRKQLFRVDSYTDVNQRKVVTETR